MAKQGETQRSHFGDPRGQTGRGPMLTFWSAFSVGTLALHGLGQPVALAGEDYNVGMVDQPVNQRCRQAVVAKDSVPLRELQIGCNNEALSLVAVGDYLKQ